MLLGTRLVLITDPRLPAGRVVEIVEAACSAGCRAIQLRRPHDEGGPVYELASRLREITARSSARLIVNDRVDVALAVGADGAHLPTAGLDPIAARALLGTDKLLGVSLHSTGEIEALRKAPVDYVQFGPVYATPSKAEYGAPQGLDGLKAAVGAAGSRPLVAVGGIDANRATDVVRAGASAVAVIGAVVGANDPAAATCELLAALSEPGRA